MNSGRLRRLLALRKQAERLDSADPRMKLVLSIERTVLAARYLAYAALMLLLFLGFRPDQVGPYVGLGIYILLHNVFVHWVLSTHRYEAFISPFNFVLHLAEITYICGLVGASDSPLFVLYLLFIIGFSTYSRLAYGGWLVTLLCCLCYGGLVFVERRFIVMETPAPAVAAKFLAIILGGWVMGSLSEFLKETEIAAEARAQELASSEATLRMILDSTGEPILTHNENELITDANDRACEFLGLTRDQLVRQRIRAYLFDDGTLPNKLATLRARGEYHGELVIVRPSGEERAVYMHVRAFIHGEKRFFVSMWHDITEQKEIQEAMRLAQTQLERINAELQRVSALKSLFLANVSLRLRSPMSAVLGFIELLLNEELGPITLEQRQGLQSSRRAVLRVFALVDELLRIDRSGDDGRETALGEASEEAGLRQDRGDYAARGLTHTETP